MIRSKLLFVSRIFALNKKFCFVKMRIHLDPFVWFSSSAKLLAHFSCREWSVMVSNEWSHLCECVLCHVPNFDSFWLLRKGPYQAINMVCFSSWITPWSVMGHEYPSMKYICLEEGHLDPCWLISFTCKPWGPCLLLNLVSVCIGKGSTCTHLLGWLMC